MASVSPEIPSRRLMGRFARPAVLLTAVAATWGLGTRLSAGSPPPFQRAWWYWHHPFRLSAAEVGQLRTAGCSRLYVHAGTLEPQAGRLTLTSRQQWLTPAPGELFAVLRVHPAAHRLLLGEGGPDALVDLLYSARLPESVRAVQLDADIPTAQLRAYAATLRRVRQRLPDGWELSITALPDWLRSQEYSRLCESVDEIAPQFYGNRWPEAGKRPPALWEAESLLSQVRRSAAGRARVWVGLPSYGRCIVLEPRGRPIGVRHDLAPEPLLDDADWSTIAAEARGGAVTEDTLALRAEAEALAGPLTVAAGSALWFQWPRLDALERVTGEIEALRLPRVAGACYFRWPAPGEPLAPRQPYVSPSTGVSLQVTAERSGRSVLVRVVNRGTDAPLPSAGVRLEVQTGGAEVVSNSPVEYR
ncbi:MAG: hypothetical protein K0Q72_3253, partial [Armatimonadetes bacterium]|nr:hypothetical protein [Armatimonadota bacterium]